MVTINRMSFQKLFFLLRKLSRLALHRSPAFEQSVVARVMMVFGAGFMIVYLIFIGTLMGLPATEARMFGLLSALMPLWMAIDFGLRFMVQQTPAVVVKPYLLLPVAFRSIINVYLVNSLLTGFSFVWLALFLPYAFVVFCGGAPFFIVLSTVLGGMMLILANSQFYLLVRTLMGRSLCWLVLPLAAFGIFWLSLFVNEDWFESQMDFLSEATVAWWYPLFCMAVLSLMYLANRMVQMRYVLDEVKRQEKRETSLKSVTQFSFLNIFGLSGEYMKLELKSMMRNKAVRLRVITSVVLISVLSLIIAFTEVYDGMMMLNFWCFYCFSLYGLTALVKVMCPEGNYIDLLMTQKENILLLLRAKYYIHVAILFIPLVLMLPAVIAGKFSILMILAYMLISSGVTYFMMFQLAIYNKQTLPLNEKLTGKNNAENGIQIIIEMGAMLLPIALVSFFILLFSQTMAYIIIGVAGLLFTLAHPLWLRHIYKRMMMRKYELMEGFHASR